MLKYKFFFWCAKKTDRFKNYQELTKVIRERMDAQSIMSNSGKINVLSSTLLKPYQMTIMQEIQRSSLNMDLSSKQMTLGDAMSQLNRDDGENHSDLLSTKIDDFIQGLLVQRDGGQAKVKKSVAEAWQQPR